VAIVGTVTSKAGFIDAEGRRVTVQDRTGAILVRYPEGARPAPVGHVIRASGEVATWYGGRQLEASQGPRTQRRGRATPTILRRPPTESDEWRLVSVTVRIIDLERSGDTWRAEATLGAAGDLPIAGLAGSHIQPDLLEEGRSARIVGIVKRAHPSASDQRFAIAPRSETDVELGRIVAVEGRDGQRGHDDRFGAGGVSEGQAGPALPLATFGRLHVFRGATVQVGGRLERISGQQLLLDDGTAEGSVRLLDVVAPLEPTLRVGEVLNVTGRVRETAPHRYEVVVASAADVRRASALRSGTLPPTLDETALLAAAMPLPAATEALTTHAPPADAPSFPGASLLLIAALAAAAGLTLGGAVALHRRAQAPAGRQEALAATALPEDDGRQGRP
jgi:hypothetical protein